MANQGLACSLPIRVQTVNRATWNCFLATRPSVHHVSVPLVHPPILPIDRFFRLSVRRSLSAPPFHHANRHADTHTHNLPTQHIESGQVDFNFDFTGSRWIAVHADEQAKT